jgi:hypothetical protein
MACIFIAMKDNPILNFIFQKREELMSIFYLEDFRFALQEVVDGLHVCRCHVRRDLFELEMAFVAVDSEVACRNSSNVDFVHFIWNNIA